MANDKKSRYDLDMTIFDDPEEKRRERLKKKFTSVNANKQAEYMSQLISEVESGIQRNREMIRRLFVELQAHPDHYKDELDAFKSELEMLKNKRRRVKNRLNRYKNQVARKQGFLRQMQQREGHSPIKEHKVNAMKKDIQIAKDKRDDLEARLSDIESRIDTLKRKLR